MIIKVKVQLKMHAIFHPLISFFHPFKNKVHQNSQAIDLTWHNVMAKWNSQLLFNWAIFYFKKYFDNQHPLVVNAIHLPN
jgi:hypothetical protein